MSAQTAVHDTNTATRVGIAAVAVVSFCFVFVLFCFVLFVFLCKFWGNIINNKINSKSNSKFNSKFNSNFLKIPVGFPSRIFEILFLLSTFPRH